MWPTLLLLLLGAIIQNQAKVEAKPTASAKIPLMSPPLQTQQHPLNPDDITLFTNMFLNLFKGVADWRNLVAADAVQSVWQSPPIVDFSHRLFST